jgi:hypothetical protein
MAYNRDQQKPVLLLLAVVLGLGNIGIGFGAYPWAKSQTKLQAVGGYHQTLNGSIVEAHVDPIRCSQSKYGTSNCAHHFDCDDYQVQHDNPTTDSKGNVTHHYYYVTEYQSCPVTTMEYNYTLVDNFGNSYPVAMNVYDNNPQQYRSEEDGDTHSIPGDVPRGIPARWQQVDTLVKEHNAPPVAVDDSYENVILGAEAKSFIEQSADVPALKDAKLLPPYTANLGDNYGIHGGYLADKMQFVCMDKPGNYATWQDRLMHSNAAIGMTAQGDVHIVAVRTSCLPNGISPDAYISALKAYWQSDKDFGKLALPKNAIILAFGVDDSGKTIEWARAKTGMPETVNGPMLKLLGLRFEGEDMSFDPDVVLGDIHATITRDAKKNELVPTYSTDNAGIVPRIILVEQPFVRMCMLHCDAPNEKGMHSFVKLKDLIPISPKWVIISVLLQILIAAILLALLAWAYYGLTYNTPKFMQDRPARNREFTSSRFGY